MEHEHKEHHQKQDATLLQIVGAIMCLSAIPYIVIGLPLSIILIGLPILALGIAMIYFGVQLYQLKKSAYIGSMVVLVLNVALAFRFSWLPLLAVIGIYVLYTNKEKLVK